MKKIYLLLIFLLLPFFVFACGGGGGDGGGTPPTQDNPPLVSLSWPTDQQLIGGTMTAEFQVSDDKGIEKVEFLIDNAIDVTKTDTSGNQGILRIDFNADALYTGTHTLKVQATDTSRNASSATVEVKVDPVELRKQALQFLRDFNTWKAPYGATGGVRRWDSMPLILEVSSDIVRDGFLSAYQEAADFWTKYTGITFQIVASAESRVENPMTGKLGVVFFEYGEPFPAGNAMCTWVNTDDSTRTHYIAAIVTVGDGYGNHKTLIAHELGHCLGIGMEVDDGTITDHSSAKWRMNPVTAEAMKILYFELVPGSLVPLS